MNYLIIGNGFDIAHNLPTKYENFVDFINNKNFFKNSDLEKLYIDEYLESFKKNNKIMKYINYSINEDSSESKWIDIENKLLEIVTCLFDWEKYLYVEYKPLLNNSNIMFHENYDKKNTVLKLKKEAVYSENLSNCRNLQHILIKLFDNNYLYSNNCVQNKSINDLYKLQTEVINDFCNFINIFTKYIKIVNTMHTKQIDLFHKKYQVVLSFNYTNTYERVYNSNIPIYYIHGSAKKNNIVLGVGSEYFDSSYKDNALNFYKFYQRITKNTDTDFLKHFDFNFILDIYGHSLDPTDEDILKECMNHADKINIYYVDEKDKHDKIKNLIKIFGKNRLIELTLGNDKKISFIQIKKDLEH